ncbi:MAG: phosphoenolpyruvate kinase [Acidimicrobiia bacterium]|nr:phosphoenolpyruvate kinase [Acidimicrobiia bacterium]
MSDRTRESTERLDAIAREIQDSYPGDGPDRQPVHTMYGGGHLFRPDTASKLGGIAQRHVEQWIPDGASLAHALDIDEEMADELLERIGHKLTVEPVEDYRLDFEDGYGNRLDEEEDTDAAAAANAVAQGKADGTLPPFVGIRVKSLGGDTHRRSLRTLQIFLDSLTENGPPPDNFVITLPKITHPDQVAIFDEVLTEHEARIGIDRVPIELMVETPQMVIDGDGLMGPRRYVDAGYGRVRGAHFGTYDYTASMGITANYQTMDHPACVFARDVMAVALAGTGVWLSDGATNVMPVPVHRGDDLSATEVEENRRSIHDAWRLHFDNVRHSLFHGFYQGWDLHPAQLVTRYAAVFSFFMEGVDQAGARLNNFVEQAAKATLVGDVFDDAATGQGLLNYFLRAINSGAMDEAEATCRTGLSTEELRTRSFLTILEGRRQSQPSER